MINRKVLLTALAALALMVPGLARADSPHFNKFSACGAQCAPDYTVTFTEVGLGDTPVTYQLSATSETFTWQCFTKSGNQPQGSPNGVSFSHESIETTITPHNGRIKGSMSLVPQEGDASCTGKGLKLCLVAVDYEGVTFEDLTNGIVIPSDETPDLSATASPYFFCVK